MNIFKRLGFALSILRCKSDCKKYWIKEDRNKYGVEYFCKKCEEPIWFD